VEEEPGRLQIRAKSEVVRVFRALHPPSEVADLALELAGSGGGRRPSTDKLPDMGNGALRRHREETGGSARERRLQTLWSLSRTHGVSWDELDEVFYRFLEEREKRADAWQKARDEMKEKAEKMLGGELNAGPLRKKRLAKMTKWSRKNLQFFKSEDMEEILNDFVTRKVIERETNERSL
jgi:hypothetical protein